MLEWYLCCAEYLSGITADAECSSSITADAECSSGITADAECSSGITADAKHLSGQGEPVSKNAYQGAVKVFSGDLKFFSSCDLKEAQSG